jgi:hypothetical protein
MATGVLRIASCFDFPACERVFRVASAASLCGALPSGLLVSSFHVFSSIPKNVVVRLRMSLALFTKAVKLLAQLPTKCVARSRIASSMSELGTLRVITGILGNCRCNACLNDGSSVARKMRVARTRVICVTICFATSSTVGMQISRVTVASGPRH